jgi:spermidine synthase
MQNSLFIEHQANGIAFYINGDLQFDTADEALYHEYLVIPTVALAAERFPQTGLRVLICGGGDGLAARDVLRFGQVHHIDLVDYNSEVLELARTIFKPFNGNSLESNIVTVYRQEALEFVSKIPDNSYHVVICDFTYPTCPEDTSIYSKEWFQQVNRILYSGGIVSSNGVSPQNRTTGFWCLYQTLLASGLMAKPLQLNIPSFRRHGYGNWGFFLASRLPINRLELEAIALPKNLQVLTREKLLKAFVFQNKIASYRQKVTIHTLDYPQLFYYLLNPNFDSPEADNLNETVNFIDIQESSNGLLAPRDALTLESVAKAWLEKIYQSSDAKINSPELGKILPVQHRYHSPKMTRECVTYLKQLLGEIDLSRLLNSLLERAQELPPRMASELKLLAEKLRSGKSLPNLPPKLTEFVMLLSFTLLMANLVTPDSVFAKGSGGSSSYDGDDSWDNRFLGLMLIVIGGYWLVSIYNRSKEE